MRRTKIVCTMGPACRSEEMIEKMVKCGMNVARLNFSHGDHKYHAETIKMLKNVRKRTGAPLAILLDTKGPEIRIKTFENGKIFLKDNDDFTLTMEDVEGSERRVSVTYSELSKQIKAGDIILIDDGKIVLRAEKTDEQNIYCKVITGGELTDRKGINIPDVHLNFPYLSEQDKSDIMFGIEHDIDFIAASFVRCKEDITELKKFVDYNGGHNIRIISKIENGEGIENFDDILAESDGIMVARGDMGVEVEFERLPGLQKRFIKKCYKAGKMVITATQMLESMITNHNPTRAEITDVANAVFDGTSAVMLSGETAVGANPLLTISVMAKVVSQAENDAFDLDVYRDFKYEMDSSDITNAVCDAVCTTAKDIKATAVIALTKLGQTARRMSKFRPYQPIVAATPVEKTFHQLALSWGVYPVIAKYQSTTDELFRHAIDCAKQLDIVVPGDKVVISAGVPLDISGNTNILKVEVVKDRIG